MKSVVLLLALATLGSTDGTLHSGPPVRPCAAASQRAKARSCACKHATPPPKPTCPSANAQPAKAAVQPSQTSAPATPPHESDKPKTAPVGVSAWRAVRQYLRQAWWYPWVPLALLGLLLIFACVRFFKRRQACWPGSPENNGIGLGTPKVYDTRSLTLMLEEIQNQLSTLRNINQKSVEDAKPAVQGDRSKTGEQTVTVTVAQPKADASSGDKAASKKGEENQGSSTTAAAPAKAVSERPVDLLGDEVNLSYEVLNLRLILERALSDRLKGNDARLQAVIGFPVSINPPSYAAGCVANIQVTVKPHSLVDGSLSVVALLPQERASNVTTTLRGTTDVGLSGKLPKDIGAVFRSRRERNESYFAREVDTIGLIEQDEVILPPPGSTGVSNLVRFGWQLRPLPGQRTVTAGLRQLLVILALPAADTAGTTQTLDVEIKSSWSRFNATTQTSSLPLKMAAWLTDQPIAGKCTREITIRNTTDVEKDLAPKVASVEWHTVSPDRAVVTLRGSNFFPGTKVILGNQIYKSVDDGVTVKSEKTLEIVVPTSSLLNDMLIDGRYGPSIPVIDPTPAQGLPPLAIRSVDISFVDKLAVLQIELRQRTNPPNVGANYLPLPDPLLQVNGTIVTSRLQFYVQTSPLAYIFRTSISADLVPQKTVNVALKFPFLDQNWDLRYQSMVEPPLTVTRVRMGSDEALLIRGREFEGEWHLRLDQDYVASKGKDEAFQNIRRDTLQFRPKPGLLKDFDNIILLPPKDPRTNATGAASGVLPAPIILPIPSAPETTRVPIFDSSAMSLSLASTDGKGSVKITGAMLDTLVDVKVDGTAAKFQVTPSGALVFVELPKEVAAAVGVHQLTLVDASGKSYQFPLVISS